MRERETGQETIREIEIEEGTGMEMQIHSKERARARAHDGEKATERELIII